MTNVRSKANTPNIGKEGNWEEGIKAGQVKKSINIDSKFTETKEKKMARSLLDKYLKDFTIETISDQNILKEIIYNEIIQLRLQEKLNELYKDSKSVPLNLIDTIHKNGDAVLRLKSSLGLLDKKEGKDEASVINSLKRRYKVWLKDNQASRNIVCPYCSKMVLLKYRTEYMDAQKHPFFRDRIIYNEHLIKMYKEHKINKDDVAQVLEVSPDYIDWVIDKIKSEEQTQEVQENNEAKTITQTDDSISGNSS